MPILNGKSLGAPHSYFYITKSGWYVIHSRLFFKKYNYDMSSTWTHDLLSTDIFLDQLR
jgi:hypothetical protein